MVCEATDYICQGLQLISENEFAASNIVEAVGKLWAGGEGILGAVFAFLKEYAQTIIGILGGGFGIWRWYHYREKILHQRLAEYLEDEGHRLNTARQHLIEAINRPRPGQRFTNPLFPPDELRRVLKERRWNPRSDMAILVRGFANTSLDRAIEKIQGRIATTEQSLVSHQEHLATTHVLRGAIAASSARLATNSGGHHDLNNQALSHFRTALTVPGFSNDLQTKEFVAHQLRKLGKAQLAEEAYQELLSQSQAIKMDRERKLHVARWRRYVAEIRQANAIEAFRAGQAPGTGALAAFNLMTAQNGPDYGALTLRAAFAPFQAWESIEQADMHYLTAYIAKNLGFVVVERRQLENARTEYESVLEQNPARNWFSKKAITRLRDAATSGITRVENAEQREYDTEWLLPAQSLQ